MLLTVLALGLVSQGSGFLAVPSSLLRSSAAAPCERPRSMLLSLSMAAKGKKTSAAGFRGFGAKPEKLENR